MSPCPSIMIVISYVKTHFSFIKSNITPPDRPTQPAHPPNHRAHAHPTQSRRGRARSVTPAGAVVVLLRRLCVCVGYRRRLPFYQFGKSEQISRTGKTVIFYRNKVFVKVLTFLQYHSAYLQRIAGNQSIEQVISSDSTGDLCIHEGFGVGKSCRNHQKMSRLMLTTSQRYMLASCSRRCGRTASAIPHTGRASSAYSQCDGVYPILIQTRESARPRMRGASGVKAGSVATACRIGCSRCSLQRRRFCCCSCGFSSRHGSASWPRPSGLRRDAPYVCLPGTGAAQHRHRLQEQALLQPYPSRLWCSGASSRLAPRSAPTRYADRRHSGPAWARLVRVPGPNRNTMACEGTGGAGRRGALVHRSPLEGSWRVFLCASRFTQAWVPVCWHDGF